jgi:hypothetical protein
VRPIHVGHAATPDETFEHIPIPQQTFLSRLYVGHHPPFPWGLAAGHIPGTGTIERVQPDESTSARLPGTCTLCRGWLQQGEGRIDQRPTCFRYHTADRPPRRHHGFSEKELLARLDDVHSRFVEVGYMDLTSSYDLEDGTIDVEVVSLPQHRGLTHAQQRASLPTDLLAADIRVIFHDSLPGADESDVHGRGRLEVVSDR